MNFLEILRIAISRRLGGQPFLTVAYFEASKFLMCIKVGMRKTSMLVAVKQGASHMQNAFLKSGLGMVLALGLMSVPALAADQPVDDHAAKTHAKKEHTDQQHSHGAATDAGEKEKCAEMMQHNKETGDTTADATRKGCGAMMGKKKAMKKG